METYHLYITSQDGSEAWTKNINEEQLKDILWIMRQNAYKSVLEAMEDDGK